MKIDVTSESILKFTEVFIPVIFQNEQGERISICQRDGGFEIVIVDEMQTHLNERNLVEIIRR